MTTIKSAAETFLNKQHRIAIVGVSRTKQDAANGIYKKLRDTGYDVYPVNPKANEVEGDTCYPNVQSIPGYVDGVIIVTKPEITEKIVRDCAEANTKWVWMHKGMGSSVSDEAVQFCRDNGINVIPGGCPMMFCENADIFHRFFCWWQGITGKQAQPITA